MKLDKKKLKKTFSHFIDRNLTDSMAIRLKYKRHIGYFPDLKNPKTFNEKLQWLKLNERTENHTIISDKFLSRNYISKRIDPKYLVPILYQTTNPKDLKPENLPSVPFVIKTNHDCGGMIFVRDLTEFQLEPAIAFFEKRLKLNYYYWSREWQYKNIKPCIIIEQLLLTKNNTLPYDYKLYCFNGKARIIAVDKDRGLKSKSRHWYDIDWNKKNIYWNTASDESIIERPLFLQNMIAMSEKLAKDFTFLRVDWYDVDGTIYIGELTLHPGGGLVQFEPSEWDQILGEMLELPTAKTYEFIYEH